MAVERSTEQDRLLVLLVERFDKLERVLRIVGRLDANLGLEELASLLDDEVASPVNEGWVESQLTTREEEEFTRESWQGLTFSPRSCPTS